MLHFLPALILILMQGSGTPDAALWMGGVPTHAAMSRALGEEAAIQLLAIVSREQVSAGPAVLPVTDSASALHPSPVRGRSFLPANCQRNRDGP
jgi:hypothetical protein